MPFPAYQLQQLAGYFVVRKGASTRPSLREIEVRTPLPCFAAHGGVYGTWRVVCGVHFPGVKHDQA